MSINGIQKRRNSTNEYEINEEWTFCWYFKIYAPQHRYKLIP